MHTDIKALFIISKNWKEPRCSSVGKWIKDIAPPDNDIYSERTMKSWENVE